MFVLSIGLVMLSVPVQVTDWKGLSPKWPVMCWWWGHTRSFFHFKFCLLLLQKTVCEPVAPPWRQLCESWSILILWRGPKDLYCVPRKWKVTKQANVSRWKKNLRQRIWASRSTDHLHYRVCPGGNTSLIVSPPDQLISSATSFAMNRIVWISASRILYSFNRHIPKIGQSAPLYHIYISLFTCIAFTPSQNTRCRWVSYTLLLVFHKQINNEHGIVTTSIVRV